MGEGAPHSEPHNGLDLRGGAQHAQGGSGSLKSWDRRVRPRLVWRNGTLLDSRVVHGVTGH